MRWSTREDSKRLEVGWGEKVSRTECLEKPEEAICSEARRSGTERPETGEVFVL